MAEANFAHFIDHFIDHFTAQFIRTYPHPIERVWRAITDPAEISDWFWTAAFEARLGATFQFGPEDGGIKGVIEVFDPPRLIRFSDPPTGGEGYFEFALTPVDGGTRLNFVQHITPGVISGKRLWPGLLAGWRRNMDHLGVFLDGSVWRRSRAVEEALAELYRPRLPEDIS